MKFTIAVERDEGKKGFVWYILDENSNRVAAGQTDREDDAWAAAQTALQKTVKVELEKRKDARVQSKGRPIPPPGSNSNDFGIG